MPYDSIRELPKQVKDNLPKHAKEIWKEAYNSAHEQYSDESNTDQRAAKVAWSAVKEKYEKGDDDNWHKKD
jgi:cation transport regulator